jgi:hypothetical protein
MMAKYSCCDPGEISVLVISKKPCNKAGRQDLVPKRESAVSPEHLLKAVRTFTHIVKCRCQSGSVPEPRHVADFIESRHPVVEGANIKEHSPCVVNEALPSVSAFQRAFGPDFVNALEHVLYAK